MKYWVKYYYRYTCLPNYYPLSATDQESAEKMAAEYAISELDFDPEVDRFEVVAADQIPLSVVRDNIVKERRELRGYRQYVAQIIRKIHYLQDMEKAFLLNDK